MAQVIAIINHKGGTGKTTTTVNLGAALTKKGFKVLLVDLDPQGSLTYHLGIKGPSFSIANVMMREAKMLDIMHEREGMKIATSNPSLSDAELTIAHAQGREKFLKTALDEVADDFDYILIDCPPAISILSINALAVASKVIIPIKPEVLSLEGVRLVCNTIDKVKTYFNPSQTIVGVLPVMYNKTKGLFSGKSKAQKENDNVIGLLKTELQVPIFKSTISLDVNVMKAPSEGQSVYKFAPKSQFVKEFDLFTNEFLAIK